jgi:hypothetical protein
MSDTTELVQNCCEAISPPQPLTGHIAVGVSSGDNTEYQWVLMHFDDGSCGGVEELPTTTESPLELGKATLQFGASVEGWTELTQATPTAISDAVNKSLLMIEGDLPLFIRFADALILLIGCLGDAFATIVGAGDTAEEPS